VEAEDEAEATCCPLTQAFLVAEWSADDDEDEDESVVDEDEDSVALESSL